MEGHELLPRKEKKKWCVTYTFFGSKWYRIVKGFQISERGAFHISDETSLSIRDYI